MRTVNIVIHHIDQQRYKCFWNTGYRMVNSVMKMFVWLIGVAMQEAITCVNIEDST